MPVSSPSSCMDLRVHLQSSASFNETTSLKLIHQWFQTWIAIPKSQLEKNQSETKHSVSSSLVLPSYSASDSFSLVENLILMKPLRPSSSGKGLCGVSGLILTQGRDREMGGWDSQGRGREGRGFQVWSIGEQEGRGEEERSWGLVLFGLVSGLILRGQRGSDNNDTGGCCRFIWERTLLPWKALRTTGKEISTLQLGSIKACIM